MVCSCAKASSYRYDEKSGKEKYHYRLQQRLATLLSLRKLHKFCDKEVDKQLKALGWMVLRFWGKDILKNTDECIKVIEESIFEFKLCNEKWGTII